MVNGRTHQSMMTCCRMWAINLDILLVLTLTKFDRFINPIREEVSSNMAISSLPSQS